MRRTATAALTATALVLLAACASDTQEAESPATNSPSPSEPSSTATPDATASAAPAVAPRTPTVSGDVTTGLTTPWDVALLPDGTAVVPERDSGIVKTVAPDGTTTEVGEFDEAEPGGEAGLLGVAVSPDFATDRSLYFYLTTDDDNRVVRRQLTEAGTMGDSEPILTGIPSANRHDGGRMTFGPDGYLYVGTGDANDADLAQDASSLAGKVLRITTDGDPAPDNPDPSSPVWSMGHRNVQGLVFDPDGNLWASEFGDQRFDELNLITAGANYGWPEVEGEGGTDQGFVDPQVTWTTDEASPSGLTYADGTLWMASLRGQTLWRITVAGGEASDPTPFLTNEYGRLRAVVPAADGTLWLLTNNTDGRLEPGPDDDRILRLALG